MLLSIPQANENGTCTQERGHRARAWTKDARAAEKKEQQEKAWDLWLNCYDPPDITIEMGFVAADATGEERDNSTRTIRNWIGKFRQLTEFSDPPGSRQHFDIWNFSKSDSDSTYFGQMPLHVSITRLAVVRLEE